MAEMKQHSPRAAVDPGPPDRQASERPSVFRALRTRNYRLWVTGAAISNSGTWMQRAAQDWLVLTQLTHHSGLAVGVTTGLQFAPLLMLSAHAGVLADRFSKRVLLLYTQSAMGVSALVLGVLVTTGVVTLWEVFACATALGLATAFDNPSRQAFVTELVGHEDVASAVGLNSASINIGQLVGPGVAGLVIAASGTGPAFLINAASFGAVLVALLRMRPNEMVPTTLLVRGPGQIREGLRYVRSRPDILLIYFVAGLVGALGLNFQIMAALMATTEFHEGPKEYGLLGSIMAVGSLGAAALAARRRKSSLRMVLGSAAGFGMCMIVSAVMPTFPLYAATLAPVGFFAIGVVNSCNTSLQLTSPSAVRGRVMSLYIIVFQGSTPVGAPIIGWIGGEFGARWAVFVGGGAAIAAVAVSAVVLSRQPHINVIFQSQLRLAFGSEPALEIEPDRSDRI
jgi:MFS family permease